MIEVSCNSFDMLFRHQVSNTRHLFGRTVSLVEHQKLCLDVAFVLASQIRYGWWFALSIRAVAAHAVLHAGGGIPYESQLFSKCDQIGRCRMPRDGRRIGMRIILGNALHLIGRKPLCDRLHDGVSALTRRIMLQLIEKIMSCLSCQGREGATPVSSTVEAVAACAGNCASCRSLCHYLGCGLRIAGCRLYDEAAAQNRTNTKR